MILAKLGLRAGEVTTLTLDDIEWRTGEMQVCRKSPTARLAQPSLGGGNTIRSATRAQGMRGLGKFLT
jgi:integrase